MLLLVGVCLTKEDWLSYKDTLISSLGNIVDAWSKQALVFIVLQGDKTIKINDSELPQYISFIDIEFMGVSKARNLCLEKARDTYADFILFHDASIFWPKESAKFLSLNRYARPKVKIRFSDDFNRVNNAQEIHGNGRIKIVNPIYDTYVGSYLFKSTEVAGLWFNEEFGPGQSTRFKSGEDVLFLFDYFGKISTRCVYESENCCLYHPERSTTYDKHLTYASGQGKVFQILFKTNPSFLLCRDFVLFWGNAIIRCLLARPNSIRILKQRVIGFFDRGI